jgi:hypothetical protein
VGVLAADDVVGGEALMIATRDSTGALPVEAAHAPAALGLEGESLKPT